MEHNVIIGLAIIALVSGKAFYGQLSERQLDTESIGEHKFIADGVINGVDINLKTLNNNGNRDIFNTHFESSKQNNDDLFSVQHKPQHGLTIDWPNTGSFERHNLMLDNNFLSNANSKFLVYLDTIPDYVFVPKEFLFDLANPTQGLVDFPILDLHKKRNILKDQAEELILSSLPSGNTIEEPNSRVDEFVLHSADTSNWQTEKPEPLLINNKNIAIHEGKLLTTEANRPTDRSHTILNSDNTDQKVPLKTLSTLEVHNSASKEPLTQTKSRLGSSSKPLAILRNTNPQFGDKTTPPSFQIGRMLSVDSELPNITNRGRPQQIIVDSNTRQTAVQAKTQSGNNVKLASQQQTKEISRKKLPPLTDIFGGKSLFNIKRKVIKVFHMNPKHEALRKFQG